MAVITCGPFPQGIHPNKPYPIVDEPMSTEVRGLHSGRVLNNQMRHRNLLRIEMNFPRRKWTDYAALRAFLETCHGRAGRFYFLDFMGSQLSPVGIYWAKVFVGIGDGVTTVFNLPSYAATSRTLYSNGATMVEGGGGGQWVFGSGTGVADVGGGLAGDKATFGTAPIVGALIYFTFIGRRYGAFKLVNEADPFVGESSNITSATIAIEEVP